MSDPRDPGGRPTGGNASDGRAEACGPRGLYGKGDILAERFMPTEAVSIWQGLFPCSITSAERMTGRVIDGRTPTNGWP